MEFLKSKYAKIKQVLAISYVEENKEFIKETRARGNRPRIIEQEPKSEVR